jgi:two-component system, sensor histidine kinase and response regulator
MKAMSEKANILVVDDEPRSLYSTEMLLSSEPYDISFATSGADALAMLDAVQPDVILLDVMMPGMNGFEVCQNLRQSSRWGHVPVILVTALDRKEDVISGLDAGADEFLTKPVNGAELRARVRTMLRIKRQYDEIQAALQLREDMAHMIVHDMRNPISTLLLQMDLLAKIKPPALVDEALVAKIRNQAYRLNAFLGDLLILAKMGSAGLKLNRKPTNVAELVHATTDQFLETARTRQIGLLTELPDGDIECSLDQKLMQRVLDNLLSNALKFSPSRSTITVRAGNGAAAPGRALCLQVIDQGFGIPKEHRERIFEKYEVVDSKNEDIPQVGLGLAFCKVVVDAHGGRIYVTDNHPRGVVFNIEI